MASWLRRLRIVAVLLPVAAVMVIYLVRPVLESALGAHRAHLLVGAVSALAVIAFALVMFAVLTRGYQIIVAQHHHLAEHGRRMAILGERDRLSREMHDNLAQVLATVHLRLCALPGCCGDKAVSRELAEITELCEESYREVRESILALRLAGADGPDLVTSLEQYVRGCERHSGQRVLLQTPPEPELGLGLGLSEDAEIQAMRIIQEALTNARKHAGTDDVSVRISPTRAEVIIDVEDEGRGFAPAGLGADLHRFGLRTMTERAALVGGTVEVTSRPGEGTRVRLRLPRVAASAGPEEVG